MDAGDASGVAGRVRARLARGAARIGRSRGRLRLLTAAAVLATTAALVTVARLTEPTGSGDPSVGDVVRVGVVQGDSIPDYLRSSRAELAGLVAVAPSGPPAETYALVTLAAYLPPDGLAAVLGDVPLAAVYARVPLPGVQTQIVRITAFRAQDVSAGMLDAALRKDREAADYRRSSAAVTGQGPAERRQRDLYTSGAAVAEAEAAAYRRSCSCVYAAVVRGSPGVLHEIARRPQVRAVDPAPEVRRVDRAVFLPPLPEQVDVVRPPADDRLPGDGTGAATAPPDGGRPRPS